MDHAIKRSAFRLFPVPVELAHAGLHIPCIRPCVLEFQGRWIFHLKILLGQYALILPLHGRHRRNQLHEDVLHGGC